ncbi:MAG: hypothetical protein WCD79_04930 [Chthoniobacteraceae bacterium]
MNERLFQWLCQTLAADVAYSDTANLCMALYCSLCYLPESLQKEMLDKRALAETFVEFIRSRNFPSNYGELWWPYYGSTFHDPRDRGHWLEVMASAFKMGRQPDHERAKRVCGKQAGKN